MIGGLIKLILLAGGSTAALIGGSAADKEWNNGNLTDWATTKAVDLGAKATETAGNLAGDVMKKGFEKATGVDPDQDGGLLGSIAPLLAGGSVGGLAKLFKFGWIKSALIGLAAVIATFFVQKALLPSDFNAAAQDQPEISQTLDRETAPPTHITPKDKKDTPNTNTFGLSAAGSGEGTPRSIQPPTDADLGLNDDDPKLHNE